MYLKSIACSAFIAMICASVALPVQAEGQSAAERRAEVKRHKDSPRAKLGAGLDVLAEGQGQGKGLASRAIASRLERFMRIQGGYVTVDVIARSDAARMKLDLEAAGMIEAQAFGNVVSGRVPLAALDSVAALGSVAGMLPVLARASVGLVTSKGDAVQRSDDARRRFDVDGRWKGRAIRVGVLSDSFNCATGPFAPGQMFTNAAQDRRNDDLPSSVVVIDDVSGCEGGVDEGRAMLQIVHDVAPGASGAFASAFGGQAGFANNILRLASAAKADVIVDDVIVFAEPMFADGVVAQAANRVARDGVPYFSSAGNQARLSYESEYRESRVQGEYGFRHDFDAGKKVDTLQSWVVEQGGFEALSFQWDAPYRSAGSATGADSDLDIYFYDAAGNLIVDCNDDPAATVCQITGYAYNLGGDPVEIAAILNDSGADIAVQVAVERYAGPKPTRIKWVQFGLGSGLAGPTEYDTRSPTTYGHANAALAEAVGAAAWYNTREGGNLLFGDKDCGVACLQGFSSAGGTPILFDDEGDRLDRPEVRRKPGVTGPDGGNTSFFFFDATNLADYPATGEPDGYPNFFGTSASAPHVAGIAALMLEASNDKLSARKVYSLLRETATDMTVRRIPGVGFEKLPKGFDYDSGYGFVDAFQAVCKAREVVDSETECDD